MALPALAAVLALAGCGGTSGSPTTPKSAASKKPQHVLVPSVHGERPAAARHRLAALGLKPAFVVLSDLCATLPPKGRIVRQDPKPGTRVHPGEDVFVQTGCGASGAIQQCRASQLGLSSNGVPGLTAGGVAVNVTLQHVRGPACVVDSTVHLAIRSADGSLAEPISGNPATLRVHRPVGPYEMLSGHWAWYNWCAAGGRLVLSAGLSTPSLSARPSSVSAPNCDFGKGRPSSLHLGSVQPEVGRACKPHPPPIRRGNCLG